MRWYRTAQEGPEEKDLQVELLLVNGVLYEESGKPVGKGLNAALAAFLKANGVENQPGEPTDPKVADRGEVPEVVVGITYVAHPGTTYPATSPSLSNPGEPGGWVTEPSNRLEGADLTVTMPNGKQLRLGLPRKLALMAWKYWSPD